MSRTARYLAVCIALIGLVVISAVIVLVTVEFTLPLNAYRDRIAAAAGQAARAEVRISGPVRLFTGLHAGVELNGLQATGKAGRFQWEAQLEQVRVRLSLIELLSGGIRIVDTLASGAVICSIMAPASENAPQAKVQPSAQTSASMRVSGIDRIRFERIAFVIDDACNRDHARVEIEALDASVPAHGQASVMARGIFKGEVWKLALDGPGPAVLIDSATPAQYKVTAEFAGARLETMSQIVLSPLSLKSDLTFESAELSTLLKPLSERVIGFGPAFLRGHLEGDLKRAVLRIDEARIDPGTTTGELSADWSGPQPKLFARISTNALDAVDVYAWVIKSLDVARIDGGDTMRRLIATARDSTGDVSVTVARVVADKFDFESVKIEGGWRAGIAQASVNGTLGRAPLGATLDADVRSDQAVLAAKIHASRVVLPKGLDVSGTVGGVDIKANTAGPIGPALLDKLTATVALREIRLMTPSGDGAAGEVKIDSGRLEILGGGTVKLAVSGKLLGEKYNARLDGADVRKFLRNEPWPLRATTTVGSLRMAAAGILEMRQNNPRIALDVAADAKKLGSLVPADWAGLPLEARGHVVASGDDWNVRIGSIRLGKSSGGGVVKGGFPLDTRPVGADIKLETLDIAELVPPGRQKDAWKSELLPRHLVLPEFDVAIAAARVRIPGMPVMAAQVKLKSRSGRLDDGRYAAQFDGVSVEGSLAADLRQPPAKVSGKLTARGLHERHFAVTRAITGLAGSVGQLDIVASATGNRPGELAAAADLTVDATDIRFSVAGSKGRSAVTGKLAEAGLAVAAGKPTTLRLNGTVVDQPLTFAARTAPLATLLPAMRAPFEATGQFAGVDVSAKGDLPGDGMQQGENLTIRAAAKNLETLNPVLGARLPSVGPVLILASISSPTGEEQFADLSIDLGESRIKGRAARRLIGARPAYDLDFSAPLLKLENIGSRYRIGGQKSRSDKKETEIDDPDTSTDDAIARLQDTLRQFDMRVRFAAQRIIGAGSEEIGRGAIAMTLEAGRLQIAPFTFTGPRDSQLEVKAEADFSGTEARYQISALSKQLFYGSILKAIDSKLNDDGTARFRLELTAHGDWRGIESRLRGKLGLVVFPKGSHAALLDFWGGGLLNSVVSKIDGRKEANLNCVSLDLDIGQGKVKSTELMLDSNRVRAAGEIEVDLIGGQLKGTLASKSKRAELFSSWLPVTIGGTYREPNIRVNPAGFAVTAGRYFFVLETYLFDTMTSKKLPEDGREDCIRIYEKAGK